MTELAPQAAIVPLTDRETSTSVDDKLELRAWLRLLTCSTMMEQRVRAFLRERYDITLPRFDIIAQLDRAPQGMTMSELSSHLMVSNGNVTGLIDRLVQEGLVSRETDATDRRSQRVRLTEAGRRQFAEMAPAHQSLIEQAFAGIGKAGLRDLYSRLGELKVALHNGSDQG